MFWIDVDVDGDFMWGKEEVTKTNLSPAPSLHLHICHPLGASIASMLADDLSYI